MILDRFLSRPYDARTAVLTILFVSLGRMLLEVGIFQGQLNAELDLVSMGAVHLTFYTYCFLAFSLVLKVTLARPFANVANAVCVGLLFAFVAPVIDLFAYPHQVRSYRFEQSLSWTLFDGQVAWSESLSVWLAIAATGAFVLVMRRSVLWALAASVGAYAAGQLYHLSQLSFTRLASTCPALTEDWQHVPRAYLQEYLLPTALALGLYFLLRRRALTPALLRLNHALPAGALCLCGAAWVGRPLSVGLVKAALMVLLAFLLLVQNGYFDRREDRLGGRAASSSDQDVVWSYHFALLAALHLGAFGYPTVAMAALFAIAGLLYHHPAFRLKEVFCLSYKVEGVWVMLAFLVGVTGGGPGIVGQGVALPALLLLGGGALVAVPKDYKDIASDREAGIPTYYVLLTRRGMTEAAAHRLVVALQAAALMTVPVLLGLRYGWEPWLALPAALALTPGALLLGIPDRGRAVEASMYGLVAYLCGVALAVWWLVSP